MFSVNPLHPYGKFLATGLALVYFTRSCVSPHLIAIRHRVASISYNQFIRIFSFLGCYIVILLV